MKMLDGSPERGCGPLHLLNYDHACVSVLNSSHIRGSGMNLRACQPHGCALDP